MVVAERMLEDLSYDSKL
jgi:hypothetical protein